jgi:sensor domain CHASE-containing protein
MNNSIAPAPRRPASERALHPRSHQNTERLTSLIERLSRQQIKSASACRDWPAWTDEYRYTLTGSIAGSADAS